MNFIDPLGLYNWEVIPGFRGWSGVEKAFFRNVVAHAKTLNGYGKVRDFLKSEFGYDLELELTEGKGDIGIVKDATPAGALAAYNDIHNRIHYGFYSMPGRAPDQPFGALSTALQDKYATTLLHELAHHAVDVSRWFRNPSWRPKDRDVFRAVDQLLPKGSKDRKLGHYEGAYVEYLLNY